MLKVLVLLNELFPNTSFTVLRKPDFLFSKFNVVELIEKVLML